jgi:hypothetical protein
VMAAVNCPLAALRGVIRLLPRSAAHILPLPPPGVCREQAQTSRRSTSRRRRFLPMKFMPWAHRPTFAHLLAVGNRRLDRRVLGASS